MTRIQPFPRLSGEQIFVRVYELPSELTNGFCFHGPKPIEFLNVDWFRVPVEMPRQLAEDMIKARNYFNPTVSYLVLGDTNEYTWVIAAAKSVFDPLAHEQAK